VGLKVGESGKVIVIGTSFDMSSETSLQVNLIAPTGGTDSTVLDADITLNTGAYSGGGQSFDANESLQFDTTASMFDIAGSWSAYVTYTSTTADPDDIYYSDTVTIPVEAVP
jgi:hypothetical protein